MNKDNLRKMAEYIRTIPENLFDMQIFRAPGNYKEVECNSVGCVIGHCTHLDADNVLRNYTRFHDDSIRFHKWAEDFTEMGMYSASFQWCFDSEWADVDNTPEGAARRIEWLIDKGLPKNWQSQMEGKASLCYY